VAETINRVIVHHPCCLYEGITDRRTHELKTSLGEILAHRVRFLRGRPHPCGPPAGALRPAQCDPDLTHVSPWATCGRSGPLGMGGRVSDVHFPMLHAMLMSSSEGERHDTHACALPPLSHRPGHAGRQDPSAHLTHDQMVHLTDHPHL